MPLVDITCVEPVEPTSYDKDRPMYDDLHEDKCKNTMMQVLLLSKYTNHEMSQIKELEVQA